MLNDLLNLIKPGMDLATELLQNKFIYFFTVIVGVYLATRILIFVIENFVHALAKKTKTEVDDKIVEVTKNPVLILVMLYGVKLALHPFVKESTIADNVTNVFQSGAILSVVIIINRIFDVIVDSWAEHFERISKMEIRHGLLPILSKVVKVLVFFVGFIFIFSAWNIEIGPLVASLGVAGLVLGLALQDPLSNVFSGISLILDRAYRVNDIISLDSGESGVVYDVGLRSTRIKTWDHEILTIPNKKMAGAVIKNVKQPDPGIKISVEFGVEYGSTPQKVKDVVVKAINQIKNVSKRDDRMTKVIFTGFGPSSLDFKAMFWVDDLAVKWDTHQEGMDAIYTALNSAKIGIPFPITTVYLKDGDKSESSSKIKKKVIKKK